MRLYPIDDPQHIAAADLLPWFVNGTLDAGEYAQVERHLATCIACTQDALMLRELQAIYDEDKKHYRVSDAGIANEHQHIDRLQSTRDRPPSRASAARRPVRWWQMLLVAQTTVIVLLAAAFLVQSGPRYYYTLSASPPPPTPEAAVVVVFDANRSERELRELLRSAHARIVDGPTREGAYTLHVPSAEQAQAIVRLRQLPWVRFAEPAP